MARISVSEASARLRVNKPRIRQLIEGGALDAAKVAGRWLVDPLAVERLRGAARAAGRPFSPANAWGLLLLAAKAEAPWLDRVERSRVRRHLRERLLLELAPRLRRRARVHRLRAHPSDLARIEAEPGIVRAGVSAAPEYGFDVIARDILDAYVPERRFAGLAKRYVLEPSDEPNVVLREVSGRWPFPPSVTFVPESVAAVDLLEADDERSRRAGQKALERIGRR